ncbi:hypothetical protein QAD02_004797 [Eretmocerus hayati]|uniref:Uncharacterized protein n=1 Tax=Eretmocerus hayati TaxID=131215 RepID=A0ACC2NQQ8_9HYME|nr:hypothetical protein QAD02_004797 [Eretmocerus hayati]
MFLTAKGLKSLLFVSLTILGPLEFVLGFNQDTDWEGAKSLYDFHATDLDGNEISLEKYRGQILVLFNAATRSCPVSAKSFKMLRALQDTYGNQGVQVVTFIIDGLMKESGTSEDIKEYIKSLEWPADVFAKIKSDGDEAHPIYKWIAAQLQDKIQQSVKILIDREGKVVAKYPPTGPLTELESAIQQYL